MASLIYKETAVQEIKSDLLQMFGVRLLIKREDLNHPFVSGNKWWKLKYNLVAIHNSRCDTVLTFGGAYSNHIFATAAAAHELQLTSVGIIRGEKTLPLNRTLSFVKERGMLLKYVSRETYRHKTESEFMDRLREEFGNFYFLPEGGTNSLALKGCEEFSKGILSKIDFDYLCLPVGTGGTMAGIIAGLGGAKKVIGISVLKNGAFLKETISALLEETYSTLFGNWSLLTGYDQGGYAKVNETLSSFMHEMKTSYRLPLDGVYTGKLLWAVMEEVKRGAFSRGSTVLVVHTGGLQGGYS